MESGSLLPSAVVSHATGESSVSAVSWPAIFGGALASSSVSLILISLSTGLGLASLSLGSGATNSATGFTVMTAIVLIVVQWLSSGMGGYITGRLRTKWAGVHSHEVFFRDTANGFLSWALATVVGAVLFASAGSSFIGMAVHSASSVASGVAQGTVQTAASGSLLSGYDADRLFRGDKSPSNAGLPAPTAEAARIFASSLSPDGLSAPDRAYLSGLVAQRTGISQADAERRVDDVVAKEKAAEVKAQQVAELARKAASALAIGTALSMLIGAFIACVAAAYGGSLRDEH